MSRFALGLMVTLGVAHVARAAYEPVPLPDPSRRWAIGATVREEYDDNIFTASTGEESSFKTSFEPQLLVNIPLEQSFFGLRYNYGVTYYTDRPGDNFDQSHSADLLFSHTFTPRWTADLRDTVRFGQEPELVDQQGSVPVVIRRRGDYLYNDLTGKVSYNLSRRWTMSLSAGWEVWRYDDPTVASASDRDGYEATLSAGYSIDPRTVVGGSYRFAVSDYINPAPPPAAPDARDSDSHTFYVSAVRRFNPQFSAQLDLGGEVRFYDDGTDTGAPFFQGSVSYTYAPESVTTAGFRYVLTATEVSAFRNAESAELFGRVTHRVTGNLRLGGDVLVALNTYGDSLSGGADANETVVRFGLRATYKFARWCDGEMAYLFDHVDSDLAGASFDRNRVQLGVRLTY